MKHSFLALAISLCSVSLSAQNNYPCANPGAKDPVLLDFTGKSRVMQSEFEYVYAKNNGGCDSVQKQTVAQYQDYLNLYINFKRKVMAAEEQGLADTDAFKKELETYRKQLAQPYLIEKDFQEKLIREAYDRSKEMVSASHLLVSCSPEAGPADTMRAYQKCIAYRDRVLAGSISFEDAAVEAKGDPSAAMNKGHLGYFSAFDMVYPFETGAYSTPVGSISMPVRTGYGYHLIKVHDRQRSPGRQRVAHIIIRVGVSHSAKDSVQAERMINEIYNQLQTGADFAEMAQTKSDDGVTGKNGGDLGWGRLIPEMENMKRTLKAGEFSKPFKSSYGWHILKVTEVEPIKSFDEAKPDIKSRISRDARSYLSRERLVERVKKEGNFTLNAATVDELVKFIPAEKESEYTRGFWKPEDTALALWKKPLYTLGAGANARTGTLMEYVQWYAKAKKGYEGATTRQATDKNMELFVEEACLAYEEAQLPAKYPEYRELLKEYRDGILLFTMTENRVWKKAVEDTTGLRKFYEDNKSKFQATERIVCTEYVSEVRATMENVQRLLQKGHNRDQVDSVINAENPLTVRIREQKFEKGRSPEEDVLFSKMPGHMTDILKYGSGYRILVVKEKLPAGQKSFEDAKSECITQYQNYLEAEWLKELEKKYPVKVKKKSLQTLYK